MKGLTFQDDARKWDICIDQAVTSSTYKVGDF